MKKYIFTERNGIHIIDLQQTVVLLGEACEFVRDLVAGGEEILFIGTKKQAQDSIEQQAQRCHMPYVNQRWLGGTLTNFQTIQARIDHLVRLEDHLARGEFDNLPKKEIRKLQEEIQRLNRQMGGIKEMTTIPGALFIVDPSKERIAVAEARRVQSPIVAMVDTNCDPDEIDHPIPSNDDAIRAIKLITSEISDAVLEGLEAREFVAEGVPEMPYEEADLLAAMETAVSVPDTPEPENGKIDTGG